MKRIDNERRKNKSFFGSRPCHVHLIAKDDGDRHFESSTYHLVCVCSSGNIYIYIYITRGNDQGNICSTRKSAIDGEEDDQPELDVPE